MVIFEKKIKTNLIKIYTKNAPIHLHHFKEFSHGSMHQPPPPPSPIKAHA